MKTMLKAAAAAVISISISTSAMASDWTPPGPIKMMIAFAAGGGADTQARLIAEELESRHGWKVIPEQVTGKGGLNTVRALQGEAGDGTAIGMIVTETLGYSMASANAGQPSDVTPITTTAGTQMAIVSPSAKGWTTLADVIAAAKAGTDIRFGVMSPMLGDLAYVIGKKNGVDFNIISVRGGKAVMNGLNAGDMDVGFAAGIQAKAVAAGDIVELASARSDALKGTPDAPLLTDFDVPYVNETAFMFAGPEGMDPAARATIASAISDIVNDPESKANAFIARAFGGPMVIAGDELVATLQQQFEDAADLMADAAE